MKLGERLVQSGIVTAGDVEAALQAQVLYGRRLGTNLLELGAIDEDRLGAALADQLGVPAADSARFETADPGVRELIGAETARRCVAFPLGYEGAELAVAMADPWDGVALAALRAAAGMSIRPYVAPEKQIRDQLDRDEPRPAQAPAVRRGLPTRPLRIGPRARTSNVPSVPLAESLARMATARSRDEIGDELLRCARGRVDTGLLFYVRGNRAQGWKAFGPGVDQSPPGLDAFVYSLALPSPLEIAYRERQPWRGHPVELPAPEAIEPLIPHDPAAEMIIYPVVVSGHVVNLLAAASRLSVEEPVTAALSEATAAAAEAYGRLIREAKAPPDR